MTNEEREQQIAERWEHVIARTLTSDPQCTGTIRCPACDGEGEVDAEDYEAIDAALGVQVWGIGREMAAVAESMDWLLSDIPFLQARLAEERHRVKELEAENERLGELCLEELTREAESHGEYDDITNDDIKRLRAQQRVLEADLRCVLRQLAAAIDAARQAGTEVPND